VLERGYPSVADANLDPSAFRMRGEVGTTSEIRTRKGGEMYIGGGLLTLIIIVLLLVWLL
jgi:hypothetical protein